MHLQQLLDHNEIFLQIFCTCTAHVVFRLIVTLWRTKSTAGQRSPRLNLHHEAEKLRRKYQAKRTTEMLTILLVLFIITELAAGVAVLMQIIYSDVICCFISLRMIILDAVLLNNAVTFVVYYRMSEQFRATFRSLWTKIYQKCAHNVGVAINT